MLVEQCVDDFLTRNGKRNTFWYDAVNLRERVRKELKSKSAKMEKENKGAVYLEGMVEKSEVTGKGADDEATD